MGGLVQESGATSRNFAHQVEELTADILRQKQVASVLDKEIKTAKPFVFEISSNGDALKGIVTQSGVEVKFSHKRSASNGEDTVDEITLKCLEFKGTRNEFEFVEKNELQDDVQQELLNGMHKLARSGEIDLHQHDAKKKYKVTTVPIPNF